MLMDDMPGEKPNERIRIRREIATAALQGLLTFGERPTEPLLAAALAVALADALIAALEPNNVKP